MARILKIVIAAAAAVLAQPALAADPAAGAKVFKGQCALCHASTPSAAPGVGPSLAGVVGRKSGTLASYGPRYSPAMKAAGKVWSSDNLKLYIANPAKAVPANRMPFARLHDPVQLDNVVAYLATLH